MQVEIDVPEAFEELFKPSKDWDNICYYGGRNSGKSTQVAIAVLVKGMQRKLRGICTREIQNSISESVHSLLSDTIKKYGLSSWQVQEQVIFNTQTGSEIFFKGLRGRGGTLGDQNIKSFEGADWAWVEEAQSVSAEAIDVLVPTIRKEGAVIYWTFNRLTPTDPVWEKIASNPDDHTYVRKVNSDAIENLLPDRIIRQREKMRKENPELFSHVWLGEPLTVATGSIYGKQLAQAREDGRIGSVPYDGSAPVYAALDLGVGDSTAICFFQTVGQEIHFIDYYESSGEDLAHYIGVLSNKPWEYRQIFLPHDAKARELQTGKTREEFFRDHGYNNVTILRPSKLVLGQDDINMTARPKFSRCWFDEVKCARLLECLRAYHYEYDDKNKLLKDRPHHDWSSHAADAFMYSLIAETEQVEVQTKINFKTFTPDVFAGEQTTGF